MICWSGLLPKQIIRDGENGFLVPINDIKAMGEKLTDLMESPSKIEEFGKKNVLTVQKYEEENVAEQWKVIIEGL